MYSDRVLWVTGNDYPVGNLKTMEDLEMQDKLEKKPSKINDMSGTNDIITSQSFQQTLTCSEPNIKNFVRKPERREEKFFFPAGHGLFFGFKLGKMD